MERRPRDHYLSQSNARQAGEAANHAAHIITHSHQLSPHYIPRIRLIQGIREKFQ